MNGMECGYNGGAGEGDWTLGEGGGVVGSRGNTTLLYLQYGSKYVKYHVIILFVQQRIKYIQLWQH